MAFLVSSSSVIIIFFNHTPQAYAYSFGGIMIAYSLFSFISGRIVIKVGILGKKMRCLVDTGAMLNCIGFNDVPKEVMDNLGPSLVSINAYGNKGLRCLGTFRTDVKAVTKNGETVFPGVMFYVLNEACAPVLGTPFVCEEIFTADVKKKEISIGDKIIRC